MPPAFERQFYATGYFDLGEDEAAVLEFRPPKAGYWSVNLNDVIGGSLQPHLRQTSINDLQAALDPDGVFRTVISPRDPGVKNWLDSAGQHFGAVLQVPRFRAARRAQHPGDAGGGFGQALAGRRAGVAEERQRALRERLAGCYQRLALDF